MEFFVEFSLEFLIDPLILLIGHHEGLELDERNSSYQRQLFGAKQFQKRTKHIPLFVK